MFKKNKKINNSIKELQEIEKLEKELNEKKKKLKRKSKIAKLNKLKKIKDKKISEYIWEWIAITQWLMDDSIDYFFQKLSSWSEKELDKNAPMYKKVWYKCGSFIWWIWKSYYQKYWEIKQWPNRAELLINMWKSWNKQEIKDVIKLQLKKWKLSPDDIANMLKEWNWSLDSQIKMMKEKREESIK